jgi:hypothetical protein
LKLVVGKWPLRNHSLFSQSSLEGFLIEPHNYRPFYVKDGQYVGAKLEECFLAFWVLIDVDLLVFNALLRKKSLQLLADWTDSVRVNFYATNRCRAIPLLTPEGQS